VHAVRFQTPGSFPHTTTRRRADFEGEIVAKRSRSMSRPERGSRAPVAGNSTSLAPIPGTATQTIYCGDNLDKLRALPDECVDLIYIDPPFNSNRNYEVFWGETKEKRAFEDRHESTQAYIDFMRPRCVELARVLKRTGSFYYHCDWHAGHYVKVMLDQLFGENQFQNEIIWKRQSGHSDSKQGSKHFGRLHDTIFFYTKADEYTWNQLYEPYDPGYVETFYSNVEEETGRRFQYGDLTGPGGAAKGNPFYEFMGVTRYWRFKKEKMEQLAREGRIVFRPKGGVPRLKRYLDESKGMPLQSVWTDIRPLINFSKEALGYPTQKPRALLDRIIQTSSNPGDIVLDGFCGCGTALASAHNLGRRWIGIDISPTACRVMATRLENECGLQERVDFYVRDLPKTPDQLRQYPPFEFENWAVTALNTVLLNGTAIPNRAKVGDKGIDGRIYPIGADKARTAGRDLFGPTDDWLPVQVKQKDKAGRPDIDLFETAMRRQGRDKGFFISFGFTADAMKEIERVRRRADGMEIIPLTVEQIIAAEKTFRL
jgi:DNA modification methylase